MYDSELGNIAQDTATNRDNAYLCMFNEGYTWAPADWQEHSFQIYSINTTSWGRNLAFDAVSNNNNWYVCGDPGSQYYGMYKSWSGDSNGAFEGVELYEEQDGSGVLLDGSKYQTLPIAPGAFGDGVTELGPGEGGVTPDDDNWGDSNLATSGAGSDIVEADKVAEDLGEVIGPAVSTDCDQDGDGYTGDYQNYNDQIQYPDTPSWNPECGDDPNDPTEFVVEPYDCDDQDPSRSPGTPEYCGDGIDNDCDNLIDDKDLGGCIAPPGSCQTGVESGGVSMDPNACLDNWTQFGRDYLASRFVCFLEERNLKADVGAFAECCGFSKTYCANDDPKGRRQGSVLRTVREFDSFSAADNDDFKCPDTANCAMRYGFPAGIDKKDAQKEFAIGLFTDNNDIKTRNLSDYYAVEFYVYFTTNFILNFKLGNFTGSTDNERNQYDKYDWLVDTPVINYVVDDPRLGSWLHVVIPLADVADPATLGDIDVFVFSAKGGLLKASGDSISVNPGVNTGLSAGPFSSI
ncbi:MAG: putative metal-binding motif-containing protein, partial [Candidatus Nanoarchaeia archaeon]